MINLQKIALNKVMAHAHSISEQCNAAAQQLAEMNASKIDKIEDIINNIGKGISVTGMTEYARSYMITMPAADYVTGEPVHLYLNVDPYSRLIELSDHGETLRRFYCVQRHSLEARNAVKVIIEENGLEEAYGELSMRLDIDTDDMGWSEYHSLMYAITTLTTAIQQIGMLHYFIS